MPFSFIAAWPAGIREAALALPVAMLLAVFIPLMLAEHYTARAQEFIKAGNMKGFGDAVNAANHIGGGMTARPYVMAAAIPLGILKSNAGSMTFEEQGNLFRQIDGLLSKALSRNSRMAVAWQHRGEVTALVDPSILPGGAPSPEECFKRALSIDPLFLPARQSLAQSFLRQGQAEKALEMLAGGLRWPYPAIDPAGYYAETEALANRLNRPDIVAIVAEVRRVHSNRVRRSIAYRETLSSLSGP